MMKRLVLNRMFCYILALFFSSFSCSVFKFHALISAKKSWLVEKNYDKKGCHLSYYKISKLKKLFLFLKVLFFIDICFFFIKISFFLLYIL